MLLVRPHPVPGELRMGFVIRTTDENGFASPRTLEVIGWRAEAAVRETPAYLGPRGPVCGLAELNEAVYDGLPARFWNARRPRYCPPCLAESEYWRAEWGLNLFVACPHHHVQLVDTCCHCGKPLRWNRPKLTECRCGADLKAADVVAAPTTVVQVCERLDAAVSGAWKDASGHDAVKLAYELHRLWLLGAYVVGTGSKPMKLSNLHSVQRSTEVVEAAAMVMSDWPANFHRLLDEIARRHGQSDPTRLTGAFGAFYKEVFSRRQPSALAPLREAFELYISQNWTGQIARRNRRLPTDAVTTHVWVPATRAAKELGWRVPRVRRAIATGLMLGHVRQLASGRTSAVVHRESLETFKLGMSALVTQADVCRMLHVGKKRVRAMVAAGILRPVTGPSIDGAAVWRFRQPEVEQLAGKVPDGAGGCVAALDQQHGADAGTRTQINPL